MQDDDEKFLENISKDLRKEYLARKETIIKKIETHYSVNESTLIENKSKGITQDKLHREVLNACIFPFKDEIGRLRLSKLDYIYVKSSPLSELGLKNVDFLIISPSKGIAIFGEAKGSVDDPNMVVEQYKKRIEIINKNLDYVKKIVPDLQRVEFVIGVRAIESNEMAKAIMRTKLNLIVWEIGEKGSQLLSLHVPPTEDRTQRTSMMHYDDDLNHTLRKVPTSIEFRTFFQDSHPVSKMELLTAIDKGINIDFTFDDVRMLVKREIDNATTKEIDDHSIYIIRKGISCYFVRCAEIEKGGRYKIKSKYGKSNYRYEELRKKWLDYSINESKEHEIINEIAKLRSEITDRNSRSGLDQFSNKE